MKNLINKMLRLFNLIGQFGSEKCTTDEERKSNELNNKGWFLVLFAVLTNLAATVVLFFILKYTELIPFDKGLVPEFATAYLGIEGITCILLLATFFFYHNISRGTAVPIIAISLVFIYYVLLALFSGKEGGVQYVLFLFFPIVFVFKTKYRATRVTFLSFLILILILTYYALNIFNPLYPLPGMILNLIYYMCVFYLVTYSVILLYLTVWRMNYIERIVKWWNVLVERGNQHYKSERGVRGNRLSNQLFLFFIAVGFFIFIAQTVVIIRAINIDYEKYIHFTWMFYPAWLISMCSLAGGYYYKNKRGNNIFYELTAMGVLASVFMFFSILTGSSSGIQYMLATFFLLPFLGTTRYKLLKIGASAFFLAVFIIGISVNFPGIYPFPTEIVRQIKSTVIGIVIASYILSTAFTWVRFDVTVRMLKIWDRLTERGFHLFARESEKRLRKIQSSVMLIFLAATLFCLVIELGLLVHMLVVLKLDVWYLLSCVLYYGLPTMAMALVLWIALYFQDRTRTILPAIVAFIPAVIWHTYMGMALSQETLFSYFKIIFFPIPFIALNRREKSHRVLIATAIVLILAGLAINVMFHFRHAPLFSLPGQYNFLMGTSVIFALTISLVLMSYYFYKQTALAEQNLEKEKKRSEALLLNVLPEEIANELKVTGRSRPTRFENATVMFSDFYGFHSLTENMKPEELIGELDLCFSEFDKIIERHNLEKLKTVGHTYMCAAGVPQNNKSNARQCVYAAIEMIEAIKKIKSERGRSGQNWDVRIGINTGPLVAGVIGEKKFVYDIWGDTVNVASRILTTGQPGKINLSRSSFEEVKDFFRCTYCGKVMAKNKGLLDQYYVNVHD